MLCPKALGLVQILPMFDEETGAEPKIVAASVVDPYLLLIRDDASIFIAQCDDRYEIEEIEREDDALLVNEWLSGCLYKDITGTFAEASKPNGTVFMFVMSTAGNLFVSLEYCQRSSIVDQGSRLIFVFHVLMVKGVCTAQSQKPDL